jgi:hypothetical protein
LKTPAETGDGTWRLVGFEVVWTAQAPANNVGGSTIAAFGHGPSYLVGIREELEVILSDGTGFQSNEQAFKKFLQDIDTGPGARGEWAERIRDNTREAAIATAVFNDRLEAAAKAQESLSKVTDRLIAIQKEQASAAKEVGDAQKELELARLELAEKLGQVTPEQAVKIKLEIDDVAFRRQLEAEKAAIQAELSARQQEWQANEQRGPGLAQEKDRLAAASLAAKNAADANAAKLKQDEENLKAAQDVLAKADERLLQPHHFGDRADTAARQYAETASRQAQEQIGLLNRSIQQEKGKQAPLETAAALSKEQFERAKKNYEDAAELERETERTIADLTAKLAAQTAKADTLAAIHGQTTATKMSAASIPHAPEDIAAQNAYANTPAGVMDPNFDWRAAILQMATGNQADARLRALINELIGLARDIHLNKADRSAYEELAGEVANLRGQIQNSR